MRRFFTDENGKVSPHKIMFAGGVSGASMWMFVIPIDAVKTHLQTSPEGKINSIWGAYKDLTYQKGTFRFLLFFSITHDL